MSYCDIAPGHPFHGPYHDTVYGFPVRDDAVLFERFDVGRVARYGEPERARLLSDAGIIRNRLKIDAVIHNARVVESLIADHGSFAAWLDRQHPLPKDDWVKLFRKTFQFTGGEITGEFLMSTGYLPGAHDENCPVYGEILTKRPAWSTV